jgi:hypothetical protein
MIIDELDKIITEAEDNIEIYFDDLDEETQKTVLASIMNAVNAEEHDEYAEKKVIEKLSSKPLFITKGTDIKRELNIDI